MLAGRVDTLNSGLDTPQASQSPTMIHGSSRKRSWRVGDPEGRDAGQTHGSEHCLGPGAALDEETGLRDMQHMTSPGLSDLESGGLAEGDTGLFREHLLPPLSHNQAAVPALEGSLLSGHPAGVLARSPHTWQTP